MEKVTSWLWMDHTRGDTPSEDSYYYDEGSVIVVRDGDSPEESPERTPAVDFMAMLKNATYERLRPNQQHLFDFLKAKGF